MEDKKITIVLTGGGTGGSVTPLLAVADDLLEKNKDFSIMWLGTSEGIERTMTSRYPFIYKAIAAGKLRRYFSLKNISDVFNIIIGFFQALIILSKTKPQLVITAGSFVSVPVIWAARLLNIPILVHQQDIVPGLANKLMAPCADIITVSFEENVKNYGAKAIWTGNPIRKEFKNLSEKKNADKPTVLVLGGGTGSESINTLVAKSIGELTTFAKVVHITGKYTERASFDDKELPGYQRYEFLDTLHIVRSINEADLIVTRAGLGTLSELSYLGKASIVIPIPHSQQEDNAKYFEEKKAVIVLHQKNLNPELFITTIQNLLADETNLKNLRENSRKAMKREANQRMLEIITKFIS